MFTLLPSFQAPPPPLPVGYLGAPLETLACAGLAAISSIFKFSAASAFQGIFTGIIATSLVMKGVKLYDPLKERMITKYVCEWISHYPKWQQISLLFALTIAALSQTLGLIAGFAFGSFRAIVLEMEKHKYLQTHYRGNPRLCHRF